MSGGHLPGEGAGLGEEEEGSLCRGPWGRGTSPGLRGGPPARLEGKRGTGAGEAGREAMECPLGQVNTLILIPRGHVVV